MSRTSLAASSLGGRVEAETVRCGSQPLIRLRLTIHTSSSVVIKAACVYGKEPLGISSTDMDISLSSPSLFDNSLFNLYFEIAPQTLLKCLSTTVGTSWKTLEYSYKPVKQSFDRHAYSFIQYLNHIPPFCTPQNDSS